MSDLRFRSLEEYRELHEDRIKELEAQVNKFQINETHILARLHALEEKERERDRIEWEREQNLDYGTLRK